MGSGDGGPGFGGGVGSEGGGSGAGGGVGSGGAGGVFCCTGTDAVLCTEIVFDRQARTKRENTARGVNIFPPSLTVKMGERSVLAEKRDSVWR